MTIPVALLLAIVQGLTEFLPVSSDGHLALAQSLLERLGAAPIPGAFGFVLLLHVGTLAAVVVYFRSDLLRVGLSLFRPVLTSVPGSPDNGRRDLGLLLLSLVPTAVIGLLLEGLVKSLLDEPIIVSLFIGVTGVVVLTTRLAPGGEARDDVPITWVQALGVGTAQGLAVLPGLSRSGLTIAAGLALGMRPLAAFRWSFLLSVPTIAGAALLEAGTMIDAARQIGSPVLYAILVTAGVGLVSLNLLARTLGSARFHHFAWYCLALSAVGTVVFSAWPS